MRIGLITGEYPPDQGGVGDFTRELGRALATLGHEVHVLTGELRMANGEWRGPVIVHRSVRGWNWGCWHDIARLDGALRFDVLNVQYQAAAYQMHPAINLLPWRLRTTRKTASSGDVPRPEGTLSLPQSRTSAPAGGIGAGSLGRRSDRHQS